MRYGALLFLAACAFADDRPTTTPFESFLRTVDYRSRVTETPPPNTFAPPSIQAALGFSDAEMKSLNAIASGFVNRGSTLRVPTSEMVFAARLELADTGKESEFLKQYIRNVEAERAEAVAKAAAQLRTALGDERYQKFDEWLRTAGAGCWLPPCAAAKR